MKKQKILYHYTKYQSLLKILESMTLKFGNLENTNDPKEYFEPNFEFTTGSLWDDDEGKIREELNNYKIICFSTDSEIPGYAHPRMWSQYGGENEGCCIVLDQDKLEKEIKKIEIFLRIKIYKKNIEYNFHINKLAYTGECVQDYVLNNLDYFFFTKFKDWENEHEFRLVINTKSLKRAIFLPIENAIIGIHFGHRFPQILKEKVMELFDKDKRFVEITWQNGVCAESRIFLSYKNYLIERARNNFIGKLLFLNSDRSTIPSSDPQILLKWLSDKNIINEKELLSLEKLCKEIFKDLSRTNTDKIKRLINSSNRFLTILEEEKICSDQLKT